MKEPEKLKIARTRGQLHKASFLDSGARIDTKRIVTHATVLSIGEHFAHMRWLGPPNSHHHDLRIAASIMYLAAPSLIL